MKLIIVGGMHKAQAEQLKTYKYRNELKIIEDASKQELARLTRAAYAVLLSSFCDGFTTRVLEAIKCEVPVITSPNTGMAEVAGDAALYANPDNPVEIAEQMKRIFKDEVLRFKLAENGKQRAKLYSWQKTRALTWQLIEETVSK